MRVKKSLSSEFYLIENLFVIILLFSSTGVLSFFFQKLFNANTGGNLIYSLTWLSIYFVVIGMYFYTNKLSDTLQFTNGYLVCFLIYVAVSLYWSIEPNKALFSVISLILTCFFGVILSNLYSLKAMFNILHIVFRLSLFFTLVFLVVLNNSLFGELGFESIFLHKNHAGFYYAISAIVFIYSYLKTEKPRKRDFIYSMLSIVLLVYTKSSLALLNFTLGSAILLALHFYYVRYMKLFLIIFISLIATYFILLEPVLTILEKSFTFTGRTIIWRESIPIILNDLFLGAGYGSFFGDAPGYPSQKLHDMFVYYLPPTLHNGFMEIIAQLGVVSLIFVMVFVYKILSKLESLKEFEHKYTSFFFVLFCMFLLENLGESVLFKYNHFITILIVYLLNVKKSGMKNSRYIMQ